ncbi:MAG TPA: CoA pyrophosphatase [Candidatus Binatia bacterium]|nr:CoA pyrophosphatase [Candidatus Binatia bacterium]
MSRDELVILQRGLRGRVPVLTPHEPGSRAAVAIVLAPGDDEARLLLIKRAEHPLDPWSGHMAFPGGRHDACDPDLAATAIRETAEEVGIDLARDGELLARLDDLHAVANGRHLDMVISPFLFRVDRPLPTRIDATEVAAALWLPMRVFRDDRFHGTIEFTREGHEMRYPAFVYEGHRVWGLTYRMIRGFLDVVASVAGAGGAGEAPETAARS